MNDASALVTRLAAVAVQVAPAFVHIGEEQHLMDRLDRWGSLADTCCMPRSSGLCLPKRKPNGLLCMTAEFAALKRYGHVSPSTLLQPGT
jgi:hypothetical protein